MSVVPIRSEAASRGARMLRTALGPGIALWLDDPAVIEVMLNPDGKLWIDRLGEGVSDTGDTMAAGSPGRGHDYGVRQRPNKSVLEILGGQKTSQDSTSERSPNSVQ